MKKYFLGTFAIAVAIAFSAFTSNHGSKLVTYYVIGEGGSGSSAFYSVQQSDPGVCGSIGSKPCEISVPAGDVSNNQILKSNLAPAEILSNRESF